MRIGIVAGEASGDKLGAALIQAFSKQYPNVSIEGMGGPQMIQAGLKNHFDMERLSVMGLIEPLRRLPDLIRLRREIYQYFITHKPDLFIGIDSPDFNLGLEKKLRDAGIPIVHYVSPSVWAWRRYRIRHIAKTVNLMLTLFPFEEKFYQEQNVPVRYVGHPLAEQIPLNPDALAACRALRIDENKTYVALFPGSRHQEIKHLARPLLLAAKKIATQMPDVCFITSVVSAKHHEAFYREYKTVAPELSLRFFMGRAQDVMAASNVVVVKSGTATLETMLFKKPMVIVYRTSRPTYLLAKCLVRTPYIGLPNLLANASLVPELIQDAVTPDAIAHHVIQYLTHPKKVADLYGRFEALHRDLKTNTSARVVQAVQECVLSK